MRLGLKAILLITGLLCFGLVIAAPPLFVEADIEIEADVSLSGAEGKVTGSIKMSADGPGAVLDPVIGALCQFLPCQGSEAQTRAVLGTSEFEIGDARTGVIVLGAGPGGISEFFAGIVTEEAAYDESGFIIHFAKDAPAKIRSITFNKDAILTEAYIGHICMKSLGIEWGFIPAGKYQVVDNKLTIPVHQRR